MKRIALLPALVFLVVTTMGAGYAFYYFDASQITSGTLDAARLPSSMTGTAANSVLLAGNTAATYGNSKATIEALVGDVSWAPNVDGGQFANARMPDSIDATTSIRLAGNDVARQIDINRTTIENALWPAASGKFSGEVAVGGGTAGKNVIVYDGTSDCAGAIKLQSGGSGKSGAVGSVTLVNATGVIPEFLPCLAGISNTTRANYPGLLCYGVVGTDNINNAGVVLRAYGPAFAALTAGDLLWIQKGTSTMARWDKDGYLYQTHTTTASAANCYIDSSTNQIMRSTSSRRYKTHISTLKPDWNKIMSMRPVFYQPKEKARRSDPFYMGFISEELEPIYPQLVEKKNGECEGVMYGHVTAINTAAIQDLKRENDELKKRIERLERLLAK